MPNATDVTFKMWAYSPQNWYFSGTKLPKRGYIPLSDFLPNLAWRRESQVRTLMPNFTIVA